MAARPTENPSRKEILQDPMVPRLMQIVWTVYPIVNKCQQGIRAQLAVIV